MPTIITVSDEDLGRENIEIVPAKLAAGYVGEAMQTLYL